MDRVSCLIVCGAIFAIILSCASAQTIHIVGDGIGWDIPPNTSVSYANWASGRTFVVGDILVFNFMTNQHDVLQVPQASYAACTQDNAIGSVITTGPANITLDSAGDHHYICTVGRHCLAGQRLAITVSSTPGAANPPMTTPPTTPTTPSPASTQPDACAPTPSTTSGGGGPTAAMGPPGGSAQPDSASTSLAISFLLIILSAGIALIF
ncbi:hypothetical protein BUALT_Bualt07G0130200 [Buddleja alternifolia]|uniref:Phytocyanin domain-containing protein n=1 Tax=Buddleja alternifolia TaxID=168488 RepID=A0AAV6XL98_9LAMI|nr:hypothetical protein BUALT_Bualt07G0130200 [Buddleja alternifolia]